MQEWSQHHGRIRHFSFYFPKLSCLSGSCGIQHHIPRSLGRVLLTCASGIRQTYLVKVVEPVEKQACPNPFQHGWTKTWRVTTWKDTSGKGRNFRSPDFQHGYLPCHWRKKSSYNIIRKTLRNSKNCYSLCKAALCEAELSCSSDLSCRGRGVVWDSVGETCFSAAAARVLSWVPND